MPSAIFLNDTFLFKHSSSIVSQISFLIWDSEGKKERESGREKAEVKKKKKKKVKKIKSKHINKKFFLKIRGWLGGPIFWPKKKNGLIPPLTQSFCVNLLVDGNWRGIKK